MATSSTLPSSNNTDLSQTIDSENNDAHLRVASFSAYLDPTEENFVLKLAESFRKNSLAITLTDDATPSQISLGRSSKTAGEGEIRVFDAEKYFNMKIGGESPTTLTDSSSSRKGWNDKNEDRVVALQRARSKKRPGTPSASSEASWNSQIPLLSSLMRNPSQIKQRKAVGNKFFAGFACRGGYCYDDKSVYVNRNASRGELEGNGKEVVAKKATQIDQNPIMLLDKMKQTERGFQGKDENINSTGLNNEEKFAFPVLNSGLKSLAAVKKQITKETIEEARPSLEVFGSRVRNKGDIAMDMERKLSVLTWDAIPKQQLITTTAAAASRSSEICEEKEDIESDASSDLFEIENISGSNGMKPFFARQLASDDCDGMSSCMTPTTLYAPSEASIEWSVVTASCAAADYSAVSECQDQDHEVRKNSNNNKPLMGNKEGQKISRPGGLLGCKSHKAVRVAETAHKVKADPAEWQHQKSSGPRLLK